MELVNHAAHTEIRNGAVNFRRPWITRHFSETLAFSNGCIQPLANLYHTPRENVEGDIKILGNLGVMAPGLGSSSLRGFD